MNREQREKRGGGEVLLKKGSSSRSQRGLRGSRFWRVVKVDGPIVNIVKV